MFKGQMTSRFNVEEKILQKKEKNKREKERKKEMKGLRSKRRISF